MKPMLPPFGSRSRWTVLTVPWIIEPAGWSPAAAANIEAVTAWAVSRWMAACAIELPPAESIDKALLVVRRWNDRPEQRGAYAEMPDSTNRPLSLFVGRGPWAFGESPPRGSVDLGRVMLHELGHVLGLGHGPLGSIMQPNYNRWYRELDGRDKLEAVLRYGVPPDGREVFSLAEFERLESEPENTWPAE